MSSTIIMTDLKWISVPELIVFTGRFSMVPMPGIIGIGIRGTMIPGIGIRGILPIPPSPGAGDILRGVMVGTAPGTLRGTAITVIMDMAVDGDIPITPGTLRITTVIGEVATSTVRITIMEDAVIITRWSPVAVVEAMEAGVPLLGTTMFPEDQAMLLQAGTVPPRSHGDHRPTEKPVPGAAVRTLEQMWPVRTVPLQK